MASKQSFGNTSGVSITILVDNRADLMVKSTEDVQRFDDEPLLAEHGFAALVDLEDAGLRILWDAGISDIALLENARRMGIDLPSVDTIALSHGHRDHYAAMTAVLQEIAPPPTAREWAKDDSMNEIEAWASGRRVHVVAHPAALRERWGIAKDGRRYGPYILPRDEWEAAGAELVLSEGPFQLGPGCWVTGAVPRESFEQAGIPSSMAYRQDGRFIRDAMEDDQAIIIHVRDKGLVVLAGCAHSGIVNTINYARKMSGIDRIWAVLGGFHLGAAGEGEVQRTIDDVRAANPHTVAPSHCTGFHAISQFAMQMPDQFVLGVVGTTYLF